MVPAVPAVGPAALPGSCPRRVQLSRQPRYRRQMKNLMETPIPGTNVQLQASYLYADYNVTSNSQPNEGGAICEQRFVQRRGGPTKCLQGGAICEQRFVQKGWVDSFLFHFQMANTKEKELVINNEI